MAVVMAPEPVPAYLPASMGEHDGFSGKFEKKALTPTRSRGTLGEAYAQAQLRFFVKRLCGLLQICCCARCEYSPGFNSTAFNSTVLLSSPHALQQQRAASEVKLEQIAQ